MKPAGKVVVLFALTAFIAGCRHRARIEPLYPPPIATGRVVPVYESEANLPPPQLPPPETPRINVPESRTTARKPLRRYPVRRRVAHTEVPAEQSAASQSAEVAASGGGSDITPIGQLTAAGESTNIQRRSQILDEINATQKGLDQLKRPLSKQEQNTASQVRTFLTRARQALNQEDLDGAHILVTKAKVLLQELTGK